MAGFMDMLVAGRTHIGYRQLRPMTTAGIDSADALLVWLARGFDMDCSESYTLLCHLVGAESPSGPAWGYAYGNTQSILDHLTDRYTDPLEALIGAPCIFNPGRATAEQHIACVRRPGRDPLMFNHGDSTGPTYIRFSRLKAAFASYTFCSAAAL